MTSRIIKLKIDPFALRRLPICQINYTFTPLTISSSIIVILVEDQDGASGTILHGFCIECWLTVQNWKKRGENKMEQIVDRSRHLLRIPRATTAWRKIFLIWSLICHFQMWMREETLDNRQRKQSGSSQGMIKVIVPITEDTLSGLTNTLPHRWRSYSVAIHTSWLNMQRLFPEYLDCN